MKRFLTPLTSPLTYMTVIMLCGYQNCGKGFQTTALPSDNHLVKAMQNTQEETSTQDPLVQAPNLHEPQVQAPNLDPQEDYSGNDETPPAPASVCQIPQFDGARAATWTPGQPVPEFDDGFVEFIGRSTGVFCLAGGPGHCRERKGYTASCGSNGKVTNYLNGTANGPDCGTPVNCL